MKRTYLEKHKPTDMLSNYGKPKPKINHGIHLDISNVLR